MIGKKGLISTFFVLGSVFGCAQAHVATESDGGAVEVKAEGKAERRKRG